MSWFKRLLGKGGSSQASPNPRMGYRFVCNRCGGRVTTRDELEAECGKHGILLANGNMVGDPSDRSKAQIAQHLEDTKGFKCTGCDTVFCMNCLYNHAPPHSNGGKACPSCGSKFAYLQ